MVQGSLNISRVLKKRCAVKNSEIDNDKDENGDRIAEKFLEQTKCTLLKRLNEQKGWSMSGSLGMIIK